MRIRALGGVAAVATLSMALTVPSALAATTGDPLDDRLWGLDSINAVQAWQSTTGVGAVVAIVDTGVDLEHPDLQGNLLPGATFTGCVDVRPCGDGDQRGPDGIDNDDGHGTHVAGTVAAVQGNDVGIAGVAPDAKILPVKVLEAGSGSSRDIADGIRWSVDNGADVVNLSLGTLPGGQAFSITGLSTEMKDAIQYATDNGVLTVAAAGNSSTPLCSDPAFNSTAICVGAVTKEGTKSYYSELPVKLDQRSIAAPGGDGLTEAGDIWSTVPTGTGDNGTDYDSYAGTSMATPHVAGVAALLYAQGRDLASVESALLETASVSVLGITGTWTPAYGWGIVDAAAAVGHGTIPEPVKSNNGNGNGKENPNK